MGDGRRFRIHHRRTLSEFEERDWVSRDGYQYEVTQLGGYVASAMADLIDAVDTERKLRDVWRLLPAEESGFTIDMCADATVTVAAPEDPSGPITRFCSLIDETDRLRFTGFDVAMLDSCKEKLCERILDGMETELINPPRVANYVRSNCPDLFSTALESGNLDVRLHNDLPPYGVSILDDRVAITGYDPDGVAVRVLVETAGFSVTDVRENNQYEFISDRAADACEKYGVKSISLAASK